MTSGTLQRWVFIWASCVCDEEHTCGWSGGIDAVIDPEDTLNGYDAVWECPCCGCEWVQKEGTW